MKNKSKPAPKPFSTNDILYSALWIVTVAVFCAFAVVWFFYTRFGGQKLSTDPASWGQFGDYVGGLINPMVGLATVVLVFLTLLVQRHELQASLIELKRSNESAAIQSFEQSLFAWLASYHGLVAAIRDVTGASGREAMQLWYLNQFSSRAVLAHSLEGTDAAAAAASLIHLNFVQDLPDMTGSNVIDDSLREELDDLYAEALIAYDDVYRHQIVNLDAALRTLYRLIRWIDRSEITDRQKWHYVALVRSQLSWIEMVYVFYNGATVVGEKFVDLADRYALFDNLEPGGDFIVGYAMYKVRTELRKDRKMAYNASAFHSSRAKELRGLEHDA